VRLLQIHPDHQDEMLKSLYLSEHRFSGGAQRERWLVDLESVAARLKAEQPFDYDVSIRLNKAPATPRPAGIFARSVVFGVVAGVARL
jgi:hypothetical protein